ncbi:MAG: Lrp/AsnC family transcriptional regulator [Treponema sp.]|nr:Lrp/AsnC family transcriptional regulator [Treponema sp.]
MEELLNLLKDGQSRTVEILAAELKTSTEDILRRLDFLERMGMIRRVFLNGQHDMPHSGAHSVQHAGTETCSASRHSCSGCSGCSKGCLLEGGFAHMGELWEVVVPK